MDGRDGFAGIRISDHFHTFDSIGWAEEDGKGEEEGEVEDEKELQERKVEKLESEEDGISGRLGSG